jgi:translation initiation factor 5A
MSDIKSTHAGSLKSGSYVLINGAPCIVKDTQTSRPGKHGHAKVRVKATDIFTGSTKEVVMPGHDSVDVPIVLKKTGSITNIEGETIDLMDMETFETVTADMKYVEESIKDKLAPSQTVMFWQIMGKIMIKSIQEEQ